MERAMKRRKKYIPFVCGVVGVILSVSGLIICQRYINEKNYKEAVQMYESNQYEEAAEKFNKLGSYKDSISYLLNIRIIIDDWESNYLYALELRDKCQYQDAIKVFEKLENYKDSAEMIDEIKELEYLDAIKQFNDKNYEQAFTYFLALEDYKDSVDKAAACINRMKESEIKEVAYQTALENFRLRNYDLALEQFNELHDYKESVDMAAKCQEAIHRNYNTISAGVSCSMGIKDSGEVICTKSNPYNLLGNLDWSNIVSVSCFGNIAIGLKEDGTVNVAAVDNSTIVVSEWKDIVSVSAGYDYVVGLKNDGTVIGVGHDAGDGQLKIDKWENIVAISTGWRHTVGLTADGIVYITGYGSSSQLRQIEDHRADWTDIIAIAAGGGSASSPGKGHTVGLRSDGTVVAVGDNTYGQCNVSGWKDIVAISAGDWHTVGLCSDGTVLSTGNYNGNTCSTEDWKDIVAISAGTGFTLGLKSDGTVMAVGYDKQNQRPDSEEWTNIKTYSGWENMKK